MPDAVRFAGKATVGKTELAADGNVGIGFKTYDLNLKLAGQTLRQLSKVFGLVLPDRMRITVDFPAPFSPTSA